MGQEVAGTIQQCTCKQYNVMQTTDIGNIDLAYRDNIVMERTQVRMKTSLMYTIIHSAKFRRFSLSVGMVESHLHDVLGDSITTRLFMQPT